MVHCGAKRRFSDQKSESIDTTFPSKIDNNQFVPRKIHSFAGKVNFRSKMTKILSRQRPFPRSKTILGFQNKFVFEDFR